MKILFPDGHEEEIVAAGRTIEAIMQDIGLNPLEMLISQGDVIIPEDTIGDDAQTIRLIRISHGG
jgi:sulfur carrier protein ThiS